MRRLLIFLLALLWAAPAWAQFDGGPGSRARTAHRPDAWLITSYYPVSGSSLNFTAPAGCSSIRLTGNIATSAGAVLQLQFNGDTTGADYTTQRVYGVSTGGASAAEVVGTGYIYVADTNVAGQVTNFEVNIADVGSTLRKSTIGRYNLTSGGAFYAFMSGGFWNISVPIFSYQLILTTGTFVAPSRISWYCVN